MKRIALLLVVAACSKEKKKDDDESKAVPKVLTCEEVAKTPLIAGLGEKAKKFVDECNREHFPDELRACFAAAKTMEDLDLCEDGPKQAEPAPSRPEAELQLEAIQKGAKAYYIENAGFPLGESPLTPATPCCESDRTDRKCAPDPAQWTKVWEELAFSIDEPHLYRYAYNGTATAFTALAVGDLDCDETESTFTLEGSVKDGEAMFQLHKPPSVE